MAVKINVYKLSDCASSLVTQYNTISDSISNLIDKYCLVLDSMESLTKYHLYESVDTMFNDMLMIISKMENASTYLNDVIARQIELENSLNSLFGSTYGASGGSSASRSSGAGSNNSNGSGKSDAGKSPGVAEGELYQSIDGTSEEVTLEDYANGFKSQIDYINSSNMLENDEQTKQKFNDTYSELNGAIDVLNGILGINKQKNGTSSATELQTQGVLTSLSNDESGNISYDTTSMYNDMVNIYVGLQTGFQNAVNKIDNLVNSGSLSSDEVEKIKNKFMQIDFNKLFDHLKECINMIANYVSTNINSK